MDTQSVEIAIFVLKALSLVCSCANRVERERDVAGH